MQQHKHTLRLLGKENNQPPRPTVVRATLHLHVSSQLTFKHWWQKYPFNKSQIFMRGHV